MNGITLALVLVILGQVVTGTLSGSLVLVVQRKFFLQDDEGQSFAMPTVISLFASLCYFWMVIENGALS